MRILKPRFVIIVCLIFYCIFVFSPVVQALVPIKQEQLIYGLSAFNGEDYLGRYRDIFCPQSEDTIYVLNDHDNVFLPTYSLVYFWPDKKAFFADRVSLNEPVKGRLEILRDGDIIRSLSKTKFVYFLPEGPYSTKTEVVVGKKAEVEYEKFCKAVVEREMLTRKFQSEQEQYQKRKRELQERIIEGEDIQGEVFPIAPQVPPELREDIPYVTEPVEVYLVNIEEGNYKMRIRAAGGKIVEKSEKNLVAISPRKKKGIGYEIIPEAKYSQREYSADWSENIYLADDDIFYLRPYSQERYNELEYEKAKDPQNEGSKEKWEWVRIEPRKDIFLQLHKRRKLIEEIMEKAYFVKSISGPTRSYTILEYRESEMPYSHFSGYKFDLSSKGRGTYTVRAIDLIDGKSIEFGERKIILVKNVDDWLLYLPVFLPALIGFLAFVRKKRNDFRVRDSNV